MGLQAYFWLRPVQFLGRTVIVWICSQPPALQTEPGIRDSCWILLVLFSIQASKKSSTAPVTASVKHRELHCLLFMKQICTGAKMTMNQKKIVLVTQRKELEAILFPGYPNAAALMGISSNTRYFCQKRQQMQTINRSLKQDSSFTQPLFRVRSILCFM